MSQSAEKLTLCDLTIAFWQGSCVFTSTNLSFALAKFTYVCSLFHKASSSVRPGKSRLICLMLAKHSSNTVYNYSLLLITAPLPCSLVVVVVVFVFLLTLSSVHFVSGGGRSQPPSPAQGKWVWPEVCVVTTTSLRSPPYRYVFCYACILHYLRENHCCPITALPTTEKQIIRLFTDVS